MTDKIQDALRKLDTTKDTHWTQDGLPAINIVKVLAGVSNVTRAEIEAAAPGFTRNSPVVTQTPVPVDVATAQAAGDLASTGDTVAPGPTTGVSPVVGEGIAPPVQLATDATAEVPDGLKAASVDITAIPQAPGDEPTLGLANTVNTNANGDLEQTGLTAGGIGLAASKPGAEDGTPDAPAVDAAGTEVAPALSQNLAEIDPAEDARKQIEGLRLDLEEVNDEISDLSDTQQRVKNELVRFQNLAAQLETQIQVLEKQANVSRGSSAIGDYLEAQKKVLAARGEVRQALKDSGLNLKELQKQLQSPLDASLKNRKK